VVSSDKNLGTPLPRNYREEGIRGKAAAGFQKSMPEAEDKPTRNPSGALPRHGPGSRGFCQYDHDAFQREGLHLLGYTKREKRVSFPLVGHAFRVNFPRNRPVPNRLPKTESGSGISWHLFAKLLDRKTRELSTLYRSGGRGLSTFFARKVYQAIAKREESCRTAAKKHELDLRQRTPVGRLGLLYLGTPEHRYLRKRRAEKVAFFEKEWKT